MNFKPTSLKVVISLVIGLLAWFLVKSAILNCSGLCPIAETLGAVIFIIIYWAWSSFQKK